jgi:hypothetical protein
MGLTPPCSPCLRGTQKRNGLSSSLFP